MTLRTIYMIFVIFLFMRYFKRLCVFFQMRRMKKRLEGFSNEQVSYIMDKVNQKVEDTQAAGGDFYYKGKKVANKQDLENTYKYAYRKMCESKGFKFSRFGKELLEYDCSHTEATCKRDTTLHDNYSKEATATIDSADCAEAKDDEGKTIMKDGKPVILCKNVQYSFKVGDKTHKGKVTNDILKDINVKFHKGDSYSIQYEPDNPDSNRLKSNLNAFKKTDNSMDHLEWRPKEKKCVLAYQPLVEFCNEEGLTYDKNIGKCSVNKKYCECRGLEWRSGTIDCKYRPGQKETSYVFGKTMTQGIAVPAHCLSPKTHLLMALGPAGMAYAATQG